MNGSATSISALSEIIPIVKQVSNSKEAEGGLKTEITDMGCQIKTSFMNDGRFDRIRIYAIVYLDNVSVPNIYIANEIKIPNSTEYNFIDFVYNDSGNAYISKITIEEFNALTPYDFKAASIEKIQNILFASNIEEQTWDIDFDARAYRCDANKKVVLNSNSGDNIVGKLDSSGKIYDTTGKVEIIVPEEHDCINPSNTNVLENDKTYIYGIKSNGNTVIGGTGPNVSY